MKWQFYKNIEEALYENEIISISALNSTSNPPMSARMFIHFDWAARSVRDIHRDTMKISANRQKEVREA